MAEGLGRQETAEATPHKGMRWHGIVAGSLALLLLGGCIKGGGESAAASPSTEPGVSAGREDENEISCSDLTHLLVDTGKGRLLEIIGTELTVRVRLNGERLLVDQGDDGTTEHNLATGNDAQLMFRPDGSD